MFLIPVRAATTDAITLSGEQTIDGVAVVGGDRVLVKDQAAAANNGVYVAASGAWARSADFDSSAEVVNGTFVPVLEGTAQAQSEWLLTTPDPIIVGTTALEFEVFRDLSGYVTETGTETLSNKTMAGEVQFVGNGGRIGITSGSTPLASIQAQTHIKNDNAVGVGLMVESYWQGSTATPFVNNDCTLFITYTKTLSNSANRSWAASCCNAYHDIPAGVVDSGERVGVIGWAGSVALPGYVHAGRLEAQCGLKGTAGYQGSGSAATAVIGTADGVQGLIYADSADATIELARAGAFASDGGPGVIETNIAVFARASNGTVANYSFYGDGGMFYNAGSMTNLGQIAAGTSFSEAASSVAARNDGNSFEFGYPSAGYGSNLGATFSLGYPFVAFCAEADPTGNTFHTRGKKGVVVSSDLAGSLIFSRLTNANAPGQSLTESARFDANGHLVLTETPILAQSTPASASADGTAGEVTWDSDYVYVCVATNTWKRTALSTW